MSIYTILKQNRNTAGLIILMGLVPLLASTSITLYALSYEETIRSFSYGIWVLVFAGATLTMALALTPTTFVAIITGYFMGWASLPLMIPSYALASLLGYLIAGSINKGKFLESIRSVERADFIVRNIRTNEAGIIFFSRISPVLPFAISNVLFAVLESRISRFLIAGTLGMLPRTILAVLAGIEAVRIKHLILHPHDSSLMETSFIALILVSLLGLFLYGKKIARNYFLKFR